MLTNDDFQKLSNIYATKDDLREMKDELVKKMDENYSKVFDLVDGLAVEIKDGRASRTIFSYRIEDLDKRMRGLEKNNCD